VNRTHIYPDWIMKIGLVSAHKHCKSHLTSLRQDGYDVSCLGARPTKIPPSYDVLIVRVASTSHGGEAVARAWTRSTGLPAIYEDGLTSIRRELTALRLARAPVGDTVDVSRSTEHDIYNALIACAEAYREARPKDGHEALGKALNSVLYGEYPESVNAGLSMIPKITAQFYPQLAGQPMKPSTLPNATYTMPSPRGPFPSSTNWSKKYTPAVLKAAFIEATDLIISVTPSTVLPFFMECYGKCEDPSLRADMLKLRENPPARKAFFRGKEFILRGKPLVYTMFVMLQKPSDEASIKRPFWTTYKSLTGSGCDTRLPDAVAWFLGRPAPVKQGVGRPQKPITPAETQTTFPNASQPPTPELPLPVATTEVDSNTRAILDLMTDLDTVRVAAASLEARFSELGDVRQAASEVRVWRTEAVAEIEGMLDVMRADVTAAFDALAKNEDEVRIASDPLAALDQIKKRLAAAGFKGTLTLTIE